ncbi:hypothetical protein SLA2020_269330 [Shorea laevis]
MPIHNDTSGMHAMLHDVFVIHDVRVDIGGGSQMGVESEFVDHEDSAEVAGKFYELLKDADKLLHDNTKHIRLWAIVVCIILLGIM